VGKAREHELRVTAFGMIALVMVAALLTISAAVVLHAKLHVSIPLQPAVEDVGGASANAHR
jgi:hypothetical protein